jgi:integrative and conjugative element protein (TIGR02256 family)
LVGHPAAAHHVPYMWCRLNTEADSPTICIAHSAAAMITRDATRSRDGLETGGILLGIDSTERIFIRHAGDAGPQAHRGPHAFLRDLEHAQRLAESAWKQDGSQWLGEWHTHPSGALTPSELDISSYLRHLKDPDLQFNRFIAIIVGLRHDNEIVAAAWLVHKNRLRAARLRITANDW